MLVVSVFVYLQQDLDLRIFGGLSVGPGTTGTSTVGVPRGELDGAALSASHVMQLSQLEGGPRQAGGGTVSRLCWWQLPCLTGSLGW